MAIRISSKNEAIANVIINRIPTGRKIKVKSMAARNGIAVIISDRDKLYAHGFWKYNEKKFPTSHGTAELITCLRELEIITASDLKEHLDHEHKQNQLRSRRYNKMLMLNGAEKLGIKLTKAQERQLAKIE